MVAASCGDSSGATDPDDQESPDSIPVYVALPPTLSGLKTGAAVSYEPAWPLWTNGLDRERGILLPTGTRVDVRSPAWSYPDGAVLLETLTRPGGGAPVETRVLLRKDGTWVPGVYLWDLAATEAVLVTDDRRVPVPVPDATGRTFEHLVPNRSDCARCHGPATSLLLGFGALQLNHRVAGVNQLESLAAAGVLSGIPSNPESMEAPDEETAWVMGYLTGNCVHCHRDEGVAVDLGHRVFLSTVVGGTGPSGRRLIVPGDAEASSVYQLLRDGIMPPLGVQLPDRTAMERLRAWIEGLAG